MAETEQYIEHPSLDDDIALLHQYARSQEPAAFVELSRRHVGVVYGTCLRITANVQDAEELTQDCFFELARRAATIRSSVGGWLHSLATRRALNAVRSRNRRREHEQSAVAISPNERTNSEAEVAWRQLELLLDQAIDSLPDELRTPIILHFLENRPQSEVALRLGVHQSTVSRHIQEALEALRARLRESGFVMAVAPLTSLLATHAGQTADPHLLSSLTKIALAGVGSGKAIGGTGAVLAQLSTWGKALIALATPVIAQLVLGGWWGFVWAMAVLGYIAWRQPKWHEELAIAMGGKGYNYEFFPLVRWTWTVPPAGWRMAIFQLSISSAMMGCVAVAVLIPYPRNPMGLGWAGMMTVYAIVPLLTAVRIWLRVRACSADAKTLSAPLPSPPDAVSVAQSVGVAIAMTLCAASFALWHVRIGQPRDWLFMLLILVVSVCLAYVDAIGKIWGFCRGRHTRGRADGYSDPAQVSNRPRAALGAILFVLVCVLIWTYGASRDCADCLWGGRPLKTQAIGWALCAPLALIFLVTMIRLLGRLRGRIPKLVWRCLATIAATCAVVNLVLVTSWIFLGPSSLPPLPSRRAATITGDIGEMQRGKAAAIPQLKKDIHSPDDDVRRRAAILLGFINVAADDVVPELRKALGDEDEEVRSCAAFALAQLGTKAKAAIPELCKALNDRNHDVRFAARSALLGVGSAAKEALPELRQALHNKDPAVRAEVIDLLNRSGEAAKDAVPNLRKALGDENDRVRIAATCSLLEIGPAAKDAIPELQNALSDPCVQVRCNAVVALGSIGPAAKDAIPALRRTLRSDENARVRMCVAGALQRFGPAAKEALPDVQKALNDSNRTVRSVAACTLGKIASPTKSVISDLRKTLHDPDKGVRASAAWSLGQMGSAATSAVPDLEKALRDEDANVRSSAASALKKIDKGEKGKMK